MTTEGSSDLNIDLVEGTEVITVCVSSTTLTSAEVLAAELVLDQRYNLIHYGREGERLGGVNEDELTDIFER